MPPARADPAEDPTARLVAEAHATDQDPHQHGGDERHGEQPGQVRGLPHAEEVTEVGMSALFSKMSVRGSTFCPGGASVNFSGPFSA